VDHNCCWISSLTSVLRYYNVTYKEPPCYKIACFLLLSCGSRLLKTAPNPILKSLRRSQTLHFPLKLSHSQSMSRDNVVSIVTRLRAGRSGVWIPTGARYIFSKTSRPTLGPLLASYSIGTGDLSRGQSGQGVKLTITSIWLSEVKNECSYMCFPSVPSWCGLGKQFFSLPQWRYIRVVWPNALLCLAGKLSNLRCLLSHRCSKLAGTLSFLFFTVDRP
jgi:hypothetical protein